MHFNHYPESNNFIPLFLLFLVTAIAAANWYIKSSIESETEKWESKMRLMQEDMNRISEYHEKRIESCANSVTERITNTHNHCLTTLEDTKKEVDSRIAQIQKGQKVELDEAWKYIQDLDERGNDDWKEILILKKEIRRKYKKMRHEIDSMRIPDLQETVWRNGFFMHLLSDKVTAFMNQSVDHNELVESRFQRVEKSAL